MLGDPGMSLMRDLVAGADFVNSDVTSGAGRDNLRAVVWGGSFDLGGGDDSADGVFSQTTILGGDGKDTLKAEYANGASFDTGDGEGDVVDIVTGVNNTVSAGEGDNTISMGRNGVSDQAKTWQTSVEHALRTRPTQTGEIARNTIMATSGETSIVINNGETSRRAATSNGLESSSPGESADAARYGRHAGDAGERRHDKTMLIAINRYRLVMDAESENAAGPAATVVSADGRREGFSAMARHEAKYEDPEGGMVSRHDPSLWPRRFRLLESLDASCRVQPGFPLPRPVTGCFSPPKLKFCAR